MRTRFVLPLGFLLVASNVYAAQQYPATKKENTTIWKHGVRIHDPYAWMENDHDPDLQTWIKAQNKFVDDALAGPERDQLAAEFQRLEASKDGDGEKSRLEFDFQMDERQFWHHRVIPGEIVSAQAKSSSERYVITLDSDTGSDLKTLRVKDVESGNYLSDLLHVKFSSFFWEEGDESFIYVSDRDARLGDTHPVIKRHILGTQQNQDQVLFEAPEHDTWVGLAKVGDRFVMTLENRYYVKRGFFDTETGTFTKTWEQETTTVSDFGFEGDKIFQISYEEADKGQVISRDMRNGDVEVLIDATDLPIDSVYRSGRTFYVTYIDNAAHRLFVHDLSKKATVHEVRLPDAGAISLSQSGDKIKVSFVRYSEKSSEWILNPETNVLEMETAAEELPFALTSTRVFYRAHDGREAPIWLVHKEGMALSPGTPVYMYGYGGFAINILPRFRDAYLPWYQRGGVVAFVTLPGGMEFGRQWMEDGQLFRKKNVFDDFAAAGKRLIQLGFTSRAKLAIGGGSNGGLLVGATANLYPDLFAAAIPEVGVMDLVNFQRFTGGKWWQADYGDREIRAEFLNQLRLSPYHQLRRRRYPATLVIPADFDDRVVPSHGYRYAARLQEWNRGRNPIYLHTRIGSSHGFTGTVSERVRYEANRWAFLIKQLGVE